LAPRSTKVVDQIARSQNCNLLIIKARAPVFGCEVLVFAKAGTSICNPFLKSPNGCENFDIGMRSTKARNADG